MKVKAKQILSGVLSVASSVGTVVTAVLTRRAAQKEQRTIFGEELTKKKRFFKAIKLYIPAIISGTVTIASTISSTILSRKAEASLTAMALLADQGWRKYKGKVKEKLGIESHKDIVKSIAEKEYDKDPHESVEDGKKLYYEEHIGFFRADPEFALAYSDLNQRLLFEEYGISKNYSMLYDLISGCDAKVENENLNPEDFQWGWSSDYLFETYGYTWVHMNMVETKENDREFFTIVWDEDPYLDPGNFGEAFVCANGPELTQFRSVLPKKKKAEVADGD